MRNLWKNVIDMPPVWLLVFMLGVWAQARIFNPIRLDLTAAVWLGWLFVGLGVTGTALAVLEFRRHKTTVIPKNIPAKMVTSGVFGLSRNPIYLADAMVLLGVVLLQHSIVGLVGVPIFMGLIEKRFIKGEEAALLGKYGDSFEAYCARTRRWL